MKYIFLFFTLALFSLSGFAQTKEILAQRTQESIKIDGNLTEKAWANAPIAADFVQNAPSPGVSPHYQTEVKVLYDNVALYVSAILYDPHPDSILKELGNRDAGENNADLFAVSIDTYWDKQNAFDFMVSASSVQTDSRIFPGASDNDDSNGDVNWNAVWDNVCKITPNGWVVEMKIPFSAIRFPEKAAQTWGINFMRVVRRIRERSYWNEVNPSVQGVINQYGVLKGLENIKPPLRLMFNPYTSGYVIYNSADGTWERNVRAGADIKYGINESFTLDMTLVPDFGQVQSDNRVFNLSPFEVKFNDYRPFFTEGTELFNKNSGLFYSRRIGGVPVKASSMTDNLGENDTLLSNPYSSQLINATKISGRTEKKLGIGVLNALTAPTYATIENKQSGEKRKEITNPLTNYNMMVFDQPIGRNSSVTFLNTNVMRNSNFRDANVSHIMTKFADKENNYAFKSNIGLSYVTDPSNEAADSSQTGYMYEAAFGKNNGRFQWEVGRREISDKYTSNDLGYLSNNRESVNSLYVSYLQFEPKGIVNKSRIGAKFVYGQYFAEKKRNYMVAKIYTHGFLLLKSFFAAGFESEIYPVAVHEYFSPRTLDGRYAILPGGAWLNPWISTDYRKKLAYDGNAGFFASGGNYPVHDTLDKFGNISYWGSISPRYRANDHLTFKYNFYLEYNDKEINWASADDDGNPIYGKRNTRNITHELSAIYNFTRRMSLSLRARHYSLRVKYNYYMSLMSNGEYQYMKNYKDNHDLNYSLINLDCIYQWEFASASFLSVVWKVAVANTPNDYGYLNQFLSYGNSFNYPFRSDVAKTNTFTVKVSYFFDSQLLKRKKVS